MVKVFFFFTRIEKKIVYSYLYFSFLHLPKKKIFLKKISFKQIGAMVFFGDLIILNLVSHGYDLGLGKQEH